MFIFPSGYLESTVAPLEIFLRHNEFDVHPLFHQHVETQADESSRFRESKFDSKSEKMFSFKIFKNNFLHTQMNVWKVNQNVSFDKVASIIM